MRTYTFIASRPGGFMNFPGKFVSSDYKIRFVVNNIFRRWFGRRPTWHWHVDGFMAEARDERGNCIHVEQVNAYERCVPDYTLLALPASGKAGAART
jgi:hypothetical protein